MAEVCLVGAVRVRIPEVGVGVTPRPSPSGAGRCLVVGSWPELRDNFGRPACGAAARAAPRLTYL